MEPQSLLGTLGIDWKLFLAQLVNFGIVLFIFWKWVATPLGETLAKRTEKIQKGLEHAEYMGAEKKKFDDWKLSEMKKIRNEADNILRTAADTADKIKQDTIVETQKQAHKILAQSRSLINSERVQMVKEVKQEVATLVVAASEKILRTKLDPRKDHELINESMKGMRQL